MADKPGTIFRVAHRQTPYSQIGNAMLRDKRLSLEAVGALGFILSFPADWRFNLEWLCRERGIGRDKGQRIVREIVASGYCVRIQHRNERGRLTAIEYLFSDDPAALSPQPENPVAVGEQQGVASSPQPGLPCTGEPRTVNPHPTNKVRGQKKVSDEDSPPLSPAPDTAEPAETEGGGGEAVDEIELPSEIRFAARWDAPARAAVADLRQSVTRNHLVPFLAEIVGPLQPPAGADGASWVRQVASRLGDRPPDLLARLARRVIGTQVRDCPAVSKLTEWADAIAAEMAAERAEREAVARRQEAERAALERLAPGVEPDAAPQRQDALALRRVFVATAIDGAAKDQAWLKDLLVLDRSGRLLSLSVGSRFEARYLESSQMHGDLVTAARRLWPQVELVRVVAHASGASGGRLREAESPGAAQSGRAA